MHGRVISDAQIQEWADEAEAGYDVDALLRNPGRPRVGKGETKVLQFRVDEQTMEAIDEAATSATVTRSDIGRLAIQEFLERHAAPASRR